MEQRKRRRRHWCKEDVRALRQHLNLTQAQLAEELGTRQQTISEWENGMYRPRGTSVTLLSIIAERSRFTYRALNEAECSAEENRHESRR
jgi:DNA-binding transcriptional regulator YiaG